MNPRRLLVKCSSVLCHSPRARRARQVILLLERLRLRRSVTPEMIERIGSTSGLAVITYNRLAYLKNCILSLNAHQWGHAAVKVIVDDSSTEAGYGDFLEECRRNGITVIRNEFNGGVAVTKNAALRCLIERGCKHLFLMEDDILIKSERTLCYYARYAEINKLQHINFALHGELNRAKEMLCFHGGWWILCYPDLTGALSYYTRELIDQIGYMDEKFHNALEHVEHTYRAAAIGYTLPFWYFADHPLNVELLAEQPAALPNSVIRQGDWQANCERAKEYWIVKHGSWLPPHPY